MSSKNELKRTIGYRLTQMRKRLAYSQQKMGEFFGISRVYYTKQEMGVSFPSHHVLHKLGEHLNVSLDWLICGKGPMFYPGKDQAGQSGKEQEKPGAASPGGLKTSQEQQQLIEHMNQVPFLYHEIMAYYHRFLFEHPALMEKEPGSNG